MGWQFTLLSTPMILALAVSGVMLGYLVTFYRDRRQDPLVALYFWITIASIVWIGFSTLKLLQTDPETKLLFFRLLHLGAAALPPLIFLFVIAFTDRTDWLRYDLVGAIFLVPVVFMLLLFVNPDGLITDGTQLVEDGIVILRVANGPGFTVFLLYNLLLVLATIALVLVEIRRIGSTYYPQAALIAIAVLTPMVFAFLTEASIPPFVTDQINLVPTSAAVSIVAFGMLLFRYRLVDLPPLAYATAMRYSPDALFVLNQDQAIVSANDHGTELLADLDSGVGAPIAAPIPGFDPESTANELVELDGASGEERYYRVFVESLTRGGRRVGWVLVLRDETEQQRRQNQLERKNEQMELFASTISHDLKNPLNVAEIYLEMAQDECESEQLDEVAKAHTRMEEIIEEVLTLARAGKQIDDLEALRLTNVVQQAWGNVETPNATLTVDSDRTILADPTMVQHVFENFFKNAVDHGGDDVNVRVGPLDNGFYVEDDGSGIPPGERDAVFEVGYSGAEEGTGFGLSIITQIATAHDWEINLREGTDGGARFEITGIDLVE